MYVTSAYRPSAYQEHLQAVWDKWTFELRDNTSPECQSLAVGRTCRAMRHQCLRPNDRYHLWPYCVACGFDASFGAGLG